MSLTQQTDSGASNDGRQGASPHVADGSARGGQSAEDIRGHGEILRSGLQGRLCECLISVQDTRVDPTILIVVEDSSGTCSLKDLGR